MKNYLSLISFKIIIDRLPNTEFTTQMVQIPSLSMAAPQVASPIHNIFTTPDRIDYQDFEMSFIVDENMSNYEEILRWMEGMGTPESTNQRADLDKTRDGARSDITVIVENSARNSNIKFLFTDCFPTSLTGLQLDARQSDVDYVEGSVTFRYNNMKFEKIG